jgi:hypothetical protein
MRKVADIINDFLNRKIVKAERRELSSELRHVCAEIEHERAERKRRRRARELAEDTTPTDVTVE